jgi:glycosyltransferase involved in cell wall biosynthesis
MSCAEAQACGLPLILTDWAGFAGFQLKKMKEAVLYVPVMIDPQGKKIKITTLVDHFSTMYKEAKKMNRQMIEKESLSWTSIDSASKIVHSNFKNLKLFTKFASEMENASELERISYRNTFTNKKKRTFNSFYLKVYRHYVGQP